MASPSRVAFFTNEYPPHIYGGAGVHVEFLSRALAAHVPVEVRCFGDQAVDEPQLTVRGYPPHPEMRENTDPRFGGATDALARCLDMAKDTLNADIVHCHTWYAQFAGVVAKRLWGAKLVLTTHSLEPLRPWKVEQLGNGYHLSSWIERTAILDADAVIAVSNETKQDVIDNFPGVDPDRIHVIHNGIDLAKYRPDLADTGVMVKHGIDPDRPFVLFVGRITRQKGIVHLVNAIKHIDPAIQIVLCAGQPDTKEIDQEMTQAVRRAGALGSHHIVWINQMLPRDEVASLYAAATVFCCPSVYEPFGIINLEAMACGTAVVASAVGGIKEVVVPGETGRLVPLDLKPGTFEPVDAAAFSKSLGEQVNAVALDPALAAGYGTAGRARVEAHFSWDAIARKTLDLYESLLD